MPKFKNSTPTHAAPASQPSSVDQPYIQMTSVKLSPIGMPMGVPTFGAPQLPTAIHQTRAPQSIPPLEMPGSNLKRALNYYADYGGCGWWRMIAPELLINISQTAIMNGLTTMVLDPRFYQAINAVRLQRQATPVQLEFVKFLKAGSAKYGFKTIYEVDDIIFKDDIPLFNRCRVAFEDPAITSSSLEMMKMCDEMCVASEYMKEYYMNKVGIKTITCIPNYPAKMWFDNHYSKERLALNYEKHKKKPRVLYAGSGTHIDVTNKTNQRDDFTHTVEAIIKSRKDFQWVFVGCFPLPLKPFIDRGEMEFIPWFPLKDLPKAYTSTNANVVYAPLEDCHFNRAKSNIKFLEAACCGIPGTFQDMVTYKDAFSHFKTGAELVDQLKVITKDESTYMKFSKKSRDYAETMWLDDHLSEFNEIYFTPWNSPDRKSLLKINTDQIRKV